MATSKQTSIAEFFTKKQQRHQKADEAKREENEAAEEARKTEPPTTIKDFFEPLPSSSSSYSSSSSTRTKGDDVTAPDPLPTSSLLTLPSPSKFERRTQAKVPFKPRRKLTFQSHHHHTDDKSRDAKQVVGDDELEDLLLQVETPKSSVQVKEKNVEDDEVVSLSPGDLVTASPHCSNTSMTSQELRTPSKRTHLRETSSFETPRKVKVEAATNLVTSPTEKQTTSDDQSATNDAIVTSSPDTVTSPPPPVMKASKNLILPHKYKKLEEQFKYLDHFVSMKWNREEETLWSYIEENMRRATRNLFTKKELGQIKYLYPEAFEFGLTEATKKTSSTTAVKHQLTVKPIYRQFGIDKKKMTGFLMVKRRSEFKLKLLNQVRIHHRNFLTKFDSSLKIGDDEITNWHPKFKINDLPDLPSSPLPSTAPASPRLISARQLLERRGLTNKAIEGIRAIAERNEARIDQQKVEKPKPEATKTNNNKDQFKGISASLLEKIRQKELHRMKCNMVRSEESEKKLEQLKSLPHIAPLLATLYRSEKKGSLKFDFVCAKLQRQPSKYIQSAITLEAQLRLMAEDSMKWITIIALGPIEYMKMDRNLSMTDVLGHLDKRWRKFETTK